METNPLIPSAGHTEAELIQMEVQKYNLPDAKIAEIKAYCATLKINGPEDKEGYKKVSEALTRVRKYRTGVEAKRKELKELPLKLGKAIDGEAKRITAQIQPEEDRLAMMKAEIDNELERRRQAEIARKRQALIQAGFEFDGFGFKCGMLVVYAQQVEDMTDEQMAEWCGRATQEMLRLDAERQAAAAAAPQPVAQTSNAPLFDDQGNLADPAPTTGPWTPPAPVKMVFDGNEIRPAHVVDVAAPPSQAAPTAKEFRPAVNGGEMTADDYLNEGTRAGFELFRRRLFEFLDTAPPMNRGQMKAEIQNWKHND